MKRKICVLAVIFILLTSLCSCGAKKDFDFMGAEKLVVFAGSTGIHVETADKEEIESISNIFESHEFTKKKSSKGYDGFKYNFKWYDASGELIEEITLMSGQRISYNGYFYDKPECKCTLEDYHIQQLFENHREDMVYVPDLSNEYSATNIISEDVTINPLSSLLSREIYKNSKKVETVESLGADAFILGASKYKDRIPSITLKDSITDTPSVNAYIFDIRVYDTDFTLCEYEVSTISKLSELPKGEYFIIYSEIYDGRGCLPDVNDYSKTTYDCIFKLTVE